MNALWIKYYIHNATTWDLTEHDIQVDQVWKIQLNLQMQQLYFFFSLIKKKQNKGEMINYFNTGERKWGKKFFEKTRWLVANDNKITYSLEAGPNWFHLNHSMSTQSSN